MAIYSKLKVYAVSSSSSDYSSPIVSLLVDDYTMTTATMHYEALGLSAVITTGITIDCGAFTTAILVVVKNSDTSNFVEARWTSRSTANKQKILPRGIFVCTDLTSSADLVLIGDTGTCLCDVHIFGT